MVRMTLPHRSKHRGNNGSSIDIPSKGNGSRSSSPNPRDSAAMATAGSLSLKVKAIRARNLAAKDKGNTSDPYLVLTLGEARDSTVSIPKNLNPEWNETIELPIIGLQSLLLEVVCWDKDRFGKDYMGEFDIALEDLFASGLVASEPAWYRLQSRKAGRKKSHVTGEVLLSFSLSDPLHTSATPHQLQQRLLALAASSHDPDTDDEDDRRLEKQDSLDSDIDAEDREGGEGSGSDEEASSSGRENGSPKADTPEKRRRRLKLKRLKRRAKQHAYEFSGLSALAGVLFIEINRITDLPPEANMTKTSFDMDPFVVTSLGKKTYKTKVVRHNLNPVYDEKLVFQVQKHEQKYSLSFSVVDRDKLSGNDFVGTTMFPVESIAQLAPEADPNTGLYHLRQPQAWGPPMTDSKKSRFRIPLSRSSSANSISKTGSRPSPTSNGSSTTHRSDSGSSTHGTPSRHPTDPTREIETKQQEQQQPRPHVEASAEHNGGPPQDDPELNYFALPLTLKHKERWETKHKPTLHIKAKYVPYKALRQQFWRAMLRQYDSDDNALISKVELTTMLDTLGSTLHESTIDRIFANYGDYDTQGEPALSHDQVVQSLEDLLEELEEKTERLKSSSRLNLASPGKEPDEFMPAPNKPDVARSDNDVEDGLAPALKHDSHGSAGLEGHTVNPDDLADERGEEHVVEIRECPICHQPRLKKKSDADIITHIATCASQDWRQVNNIVMAGFVTSSQAQRKWYSKVVTKIGYGGYKLGANSANILVQDRITGQINEERMSVYVRLGIRLLYKGLKSKKMEGERIRRMLRKMSFQQGRKYDDPASAAEIQSFINFHRLDMSEVLLPVEEFRNFNEFFYRKLKPTARRCSAPDRPEIVTSPADCRSVVFNTLEEAQRIWVKGREFTVQRLLGNAYPQDAKRYVGGSLGIMRLAPQDYHRFHIPVDGIMGEPKLIDGEYYTVNPMAIRSALDVYGENIRVVVPIDSVTHGRVMVICVGAMMVGSTVITRKAGEKVSRAEELGYFKFGGSTILLLFEPGQMNFDEDMVENSSGALETLIRVGMSIGHSIDQAPHTPDMRKKWENVTKEEQAEAKRRIEGSLNAESGKGTSMGAKMM